MGMAQPGPLPVPTLMLVTDRALLASRDWSELAQAAAAGGVNAVQIREPGLTARELFSIVTSIQSALPSGVLTIVNDRLDVALACGADGVQLGARSLPVRIARGIAGELTLGASVHSLEEAVQAERDGADYLVVGTMFPSRSHPGKAPEGLPLLREIRGTVGLPLIGIGGVTAERASSVMKAGASGVAVISEIMAANDVEQSARRLRQALQ